ncbi:hypothetical protein K7432_008767 [Basidiobolus ranarum]|uniref:C2H2-type domain-containing protein n=1 Tax=Basidiobolus ranarum TaxID=34480 RepID=A0ABR2VY29_9FUNG
MQVMDEVHTNQFPDTWFSCPFGNCTCKFKAYDLVKRHVLEHHMNTFSRCDSDYCETCLSHSQGGLPHVRSNSISDTSKRKRDLTSSVAPMEKNPKYNCVRDSEPSTYPETTGRLSIQTGPHISETSDTSKNMEFNSNSPKISSPTLPSIRSIFNMDERIQQPFSPLTMSTASQSGTHGYAVPSLPSLEELSFTPVTYSYNPWATSTTIYPCQVFGCNMKFDRMEYLHRHLLYHPPEDPRSSGSNIEPRPPM